MKNEDVCVLSDEDFKRTVGVQRDIFNVILEAIKKNIREFGRPPKLSRTEFHIGVSDGISCMQDNQKD